MENPTASIIFKIIKVYLLVHMKYQHIAGNLNLILVRLHPCLATLSCEFLAKYQAMSTYAKGLVG